MKQTPIDYFVFLSLSNSVGEWGEANFGATTPENVSDPALGFLEEIGELTHAILKKKQGIRGTPEEHNAAARDALGDMGIFLLHLWFRQTKLDPSIRMNTGALARYTGSPPDEDYPGATQDMLGRLAMGAAELLLVRTIHQVDFAERWARAYELALAVSHSAASKLGVDFWPQVRDTWERIVSKRNWIANPSGSPDPA